VHRQNFVFYFELFGLESDVTKEVRMEIYKANLNLLETLTEDRDKCWSAFEGVNEND